jgi:hypothetical protein
LHDCQICRYVHAFDAVNRFLAGVIQEDPREADTFVRIRERVKTDCPPADIRDAFFK